MRDYVDEVDWGYNSPCGLLYPCTQIGTALIKATKNGHVRVVRVLLKGGANVNHRGKVHPVAGFGTCEVECMLPLGLGFSVD